MTEERKLSRDAVARLSERLKDECPRLARELLPGGEAARGLYRAARREAGGPGDSMTVYLTGPKKGKWKHFGGDINGQTHGDMLDLIMATQHLDKPGAHAWALRWLGLAPGAVEFRRTPEEEALARKAAAEVRRAAMEKLDRRRKSDRAMWFTCPPLSLDNPAGQYMAGRIPGFAKLLELDWGLHALRFHHALEHPYANGRTFPAMLAWVQFPNGRIATLHRYYLRQVEGGWDVLRKGRDGLDGKLSTCAVDGGFVPVWRGCRINTDRQGRETGEIVAGWPWSDERAGPEVVVCEGVEDAASLAVAKPERRFAASLSLPNFMQIKLPEWARRVVWFADDDGDNQQTPQLMDRALERLEEQGREVAIARPPAGWKDANAALRGVAA